MNASKHISFKPFKLIGLDAKSLERKRMCKKNFIFGHSTQIFLRALLTPSEILSQTPATVTNPDSPRRRDRQTVQIEEARQIAPPPPPPAPIPSQILHPSLHVDALVHAQNHFPYSIYTASPAQSLHPQRPLQTPPPQTWQATGIAPHQTHAAAPSQLLDRPPFRENAWGDYSHHPHAETVNPAAYDYRYRDPSPWASTAYYDTPAVPVRGLNACSVFLTNSRIYSV